MADDFNLRAAAKSSFDTIFKSAYPQLAGMITSINEEVNKLAQDTKREIRSLTLNIENLSDKLLVTKNSIASLTQTQDRFVEYYKDLLEAVDKLEIDSSSSLPIPDINLGGKGKKEPAPKAKPTPPGSKAKKVGGAAALLGLGYLGYNALSDDEEDASPAGSSGGGSLGSISTSGAIRFVADKIIFNSASGGGPSVSSSTSQGSSFNMEESSGSQSVTTSTKVSSRTTISSLPNDKIAPAGGGGGGMGSSSFKDEDDPNATKVERPSRSLSIQNASYGQSQSDKKAETGSAERPKNVSLEGSGDVSKIDQSLLSAFYKASEEYGEPVTITSGFRSDEKQAELYARWMAGEPGIYTPARPVEARTVTVRGKTYNVPGGGRGSTHSSGTAIDSPQAAALDKAGLLKKYGLSRPHANSGDPVHIQLAGGAQPIDEKQEGPQGTRVASRPTSGAAVNKTSIESKVDKEQAQASSSQVQINNLVTDNSKPASGQQPQHVAKGGEISSRERISGLVAAA